MPPRNIYIIFVAAIMALACYKKADKFRDSAALGDAMALIDRYYVDQVDKEKLLTSAMEGLTSRLDPYTQYIPPNALESFQDSIQQEFAGIGILIEQPTANQGVRVITPLVNSPALQAGFLPGDWIVNVGGTDTAQAKMQEVSELLRGPVGTKVSVRVRRRTDIPFTRESLEEALEALDAAGDTTGDAVPGAVGDDAGSPEPEETEPKETGPEETEPEETEPEYVELELIVQRANIQLESVAGDYRNAEDQWVYRLAEDPKISYIRLTGFGERTTDELSKVLKGLDASSTGLILDLRGNAGGLLTAAVDVCDMFLDKGMIVSTRGRGILEEGATANTVKEESAWQATPGVLVPKDLPLTVLVDRESASAAEIVAACLADHGRATIVGERSFGKGSVQNVFPLENGRSALKLTTARYYRPNGHNIHRKEGDGEDAEWGVSPSTGFEVKVDNEGRRRLYRRLEMAAYPSYAESLPERDRVNGDLQEVDPQLFRAIESVRNKRDGSADDSGSHSPSKTELAEPTAA